MTNKIDTDKSIYRKELKDGEVFNIQYNEKIINSFLYEKYKTQYVVLVIERQNKEDISKWNLESSQMEIGPILIYF